MKKGFVFLLTLLLIAALFAGCNGKGNVSTTDDGRVNGTNDALPGETADMDNGKDMLDPEKDTGSDTGSDKNPGTDNGDDTVSKNRIIRGTGTPDMVTGKKPTARKTVQQAPQQTQPAPAPQQPQSETGAPNAGQGQNTPESGRRAPGQPPRGSHRI